MDSINILQTRYNIMLMRFPVLLYIPIQFPQIQQKQTNQ